MAHLSTQPLEKNDPIDATGEPEPSLEVQVGDLLRQQGLKLVAAESCTGGLVGHRVTNVPGSSDYYLGSITAYANEAKMRLLGVRAETLQQYGAVSEETVLEMARGARQALAGEFPVENLVGVSVSGIAGPGGGTPEKPVGLVWIGLSGPGFDRAYKYLWQGDRVLNKELSAEQALRLVIDYLRERNVEMKLDQVQVKARWDPAGKFIPEQFTWQGQLVRVEGTGRHWEDEQGWHILCMAMNGQVFELVFRLNPAGWWLRPPAGGPKLA